ncbi:MAG: hypothetical protein IKY71_08040, partial [Bacteroidaceae bacterium]|nr:hypothetical protein [Bacteroidaceae bacterium]
MAIYVSLFCLFLIDYDAQALSMEDKPYFCNVTLDKEGQILGDGDTIYITCEVANCETMPAKCQANIDRYSGTISVELYYNEQTNKYEGSYTLGDTYDNPNRPCYIREIWCEGFHTYFNESVHPFGEFSFVYNNKCKNGIHYPVTEEGYEPTCTENGVTEETKCSLCETIIVEKSEIPALGHKYDNACDTTCNNCSATRTITHDNAPATCTAPATCKVCKTTSGKALGHNKDKGTVTKKATYTA